MSSGTDTAGALHIELQRKINTLRRQLDHRLDQQAEAADARHRELADRVAAAGAQLAAIGAACDEIRRQTDGELRGARQAIARLTEEVHLIEARLRLEHGVHPVDLDTVPSEVAALVTRVRAAEQIRAGMLSERRRAELRDVLTSYAEMRHQVAQSRARALDASRALAREKVRSRRFRKAAASYRMHRGQFRAREKAIADREPGMRTAEAELLRDAERQEAYAAQQGAEALAGLTAHLSRRIDLAVQTHALFPAWFTITGLGHRPSGARSAEWRETATRVLLYRITYQVTHGVLALGERPADGYQAERHDEIIDALRRWVP
jgi:hypothetical protein